MTWTPEFAGAKVYPAHKSNYYDYRDHGGVKCKPRAFCVHTPEEPSDDYESTPVWFSLEHPAQAGSTKLYIDSDGDRYEMVPPGCAAIANGKTADKPWPAWADQSTSLNWQTDHAEVEGYAATIHETCLRGGPQWVSLARSIEESSRIRGWPLEDRERVFGHYQVAGNRVDPGKLDLAALHADALALRAPAEGDIMDIAWVTAGQYGRDKTYLAFVNAAGQMKRTHVVDGDQERALQAAGLIPALPKKITQAQLDKYADA